MLTKNELRAKYRAQNLSFSSVERKLASEKLCAAVITTPLWHQSNSILLYCPLSDEIDIQPLIAQALKARKQVALPRFSNRSATYTAARIEDAKRDLVKGKYEVMEPAGHCPAHALNQLDLTLVPGVAFDDTGRRLGRGKGYYDRMLSQITGFKMGVAFDWQACEGVPTESHDVILDCILTPTRWLKQLDNARL